MPQVPGLPPQATDSVAVTDTVALRDIIRSDTAWVGHVTDPGQTLSVVWTYLTERLLDPLLWIGFAGLVIRVVLVITIAGLILRLIKRLSRSYNGRFEHLPALHPRRQRASTVTNLLASVARYVVWPLALIIILSQIGVEVGALIATAGIAGVAIGFGAQTLVRDVISGVFLLFDDTLHIGDLVRVGSDEGVVEHIGVRLIKVRRYNGEVLMIPAGELRIFGNRSIGFARAVVNVRLSYEQPTRPVLDVMQRVAETWAETHRDIVLQEKPDVQAILDFADSAVTARIAIQVIPGEQWGAEREMRMMLKEAFDEAGIEIPFPRQTLYLRREDAPPSFSQDSPPEAS